jgi:hypothetical protein
MVLDLILSILKAKAYPGTPLYGGSDKSPALTNIVKDKDEFTVADNISVRCVESVASSVIVR